jgi:hypothetical protein
MFACTQVAVRFYYRTNLGSCLIHNSQTCGLTQGKIFYRRKVMTDEASAQAKTELKEVADNAGARTAAINANPKISLEEAANAAAGEGPNASGGTAPSDTEIHIPSTSDPFATDLPTANTPDPKSANPANPNAAS